MVELSTCIKETPCVACTHMGIAHMTNSVSFVEITEFHPFKTITFSFCNFNFIGVPSVLAIC